MRKQPKKNQINSKKNLRKKKKEGITNKFCILKISPISVGISPSNKLEVRSLQKKEN